MPRETVLQIVLVLGLKLATLCKNLLNQVVADRLNVLLSKLNVSTLLLSNSTRRFIVGESLRPCQ